ncbi:hypothetical protein SBA3_1280004 [Candidatus Sulfopaludibacter sp. SbA3]|nr:hypothetical protein SBA3_1280004 [Candidatus Sulfopaludibacter sp. SbA3]
MSLWAPAICPYLPGVDDSTANLAALRVVFTDIWGHHKSCWYRLPDPIPKPRLPATTFLTAQQRTAGEAEAQEIESTEPWRATYLLRETIQWARAHPDDPRVPRALHMAVAASRYRWTDGATGRYSKEALDLLHRRYPKSEWTAQTRYWYK